MLKASICIGEKKRDSPPHSARFASRLGGKRGERKRKEKKKTKKKWKSLLTRVKPRLREERGTESSHSALQCTVTSGR